jgi:hypothetical protein
MIHGDSGRSWKILEDPGRILEESRKNPGTVEESWKNLGRLLELLKILEESWNS